MDKEYLEEGMSNDPNNDPNVAILTAGFDASSLKVSVLRGILLENDVEYPSNAKKKELLRLFERHVAPKQAQQVFEPEVIELHSDEPELPKKVRRRRRKQKSEKVDADEKPFKAVESPKPSPFSPNSPLKATPEKVKATPEKVKATPEKDSSKVDEKVAAPQVVAAPVATPEKVSKKRKSMFDELNLKLSPNLPKGNVFDVESGSEDDLLSPKRKKPKAEPPIVKPPKVATPVKHVQSSPLAKPSATPSRVDDSFADKSRSSHASVTPRAHDKSAASPLAVESSITHDYSTASSTGQPKTQAHSLLLTDVLTDSARGFDNALAKLKKSEPKDTTSRKDEEVAKLLGIDLQRVKPKAKGKRVMTPRRPIIIQEKDLGYRDELSPSGLTDDESESEEQPTETSVHEPEKSLQEPETTSQEHQTQKRDTVKKPRFSGFRRNFARFLVYFVLWLLAAGGLLFGYWYREQTFLIGYCGQEINRTTIPDTPEMPKALVELGRYVDANFKPKCVECPQHGRCFPELELACYDDFVKFTPWYFPYMPIVDPKLQKCIPDTKKAEKIEIMIDVALDLLRARNGNLNCGRTPEDNMDAGISIADLHDLLLAMKAPYITEEEFEELWERSVVELEKEQEIIVRQVTHF